MHSECDTFFNVSRKCRKIDEFCTTITEDSEIISLTYYEADDTGKVMQAPFSLNLALHVNLTFRIKRKDR